VAKYATNRTIECVCRKRAHGKISNVTTRMYVLQNLAKKEYAFVPCDRLGPCVLWPKTSRPLDPKIAYRRSPVVQPNVG
jgi:hypothetical protein